MSKMDKIQALTMVTLFACLLLCPTGLVFEMEILSLIGFAGFILNGFLFLILLAIEIIIYDD